MNGLDTDQAECWDKNGYLVVRQAASPDLVEQASTAIWTALGMRPDRAEDWYDERRRNAVGIDRRGMIPIYHDEPLWRCRELPSIYAAFRELYGEDDLRVSVDRVNMNPPVRDGWDYSGFIHWDIDVGCRPIPFTLQGLLALTDSVPGEGGFQCVPGFHRRIEAWLDQQPDGYSERFPDTSGMDVEAVPLSAGDFLIWHSALPHGNAPNSGASPRLAQYITMMPAEDLSAEIQERQVDVILRGGAPVAPGGTQLPPDPRGLKFQTELSELGRRLAGLGRETGRGQD